MTATDPIASTTVIPSAAGLQPLVRAQRDALERDRRLPPALVQAMVEAGLFRMWLPASLGGLESDPATFLEVVEAVARVDGSAGWCLMIGASYGLFAGYLGEEVAGEIYGRHPPTAIVGGTLSPNGAAVATDGGYRVSGRWSFASGIQHCSWLIGSCVVYDGDSPRRGADGFPENRILFFPAEAAEIIDTWHVGGLRGTGSHDYAVSDLFVSRERSFDAAAPQPRQPGPLYRFPITLLTFSVGAALLGMARGAIDAVMDLAVARTPSAPSPSLGERAAIQADVARAEALVRSARSFLLDAAGDIWRTLGAGDEAPDAQRTLLRLASAHATTSAVQAVDLMYAAAGAGAISETSPLVRCSREVHVAAEHLAVAPAYFERCGRALLGR